MNQEYATANFYLAAYLACCGLNMIRVDRENKKALFVFQDTSKRPAYVDQFLLEDKAAVDVKTFVAQIKKQKSLLYD